jgi:hypothetical protein
MRDLNTPLSSSIFDGDKKPSKRKVRKANEEKAKKDAYMLNLRQARMRNEIKENAANPDSKKREDAKNQNQADSALRKNIITNAKAKGGKTGYGK